LKKSKKAQFRCEDLSPTIKEFRQSKTHGKVIRLDNKSFEVIGSELGLNLETNLIERIDINKN